ncbi:MAG TPA: ester cyclase [Pseudoxanthomonas sp.]
MNKSVARTLMLTVALGTTACKPVAPPETHAAAAGPMASAAAPEAIQASTVAENNKRIMQRFTGEFLPTGDAALAEQFLSPDVTIYFAGQKQQGRDTYLGLVAANRAAFPDLVWTVDQMVAEGDTVAIRYTMTGTHRGDFAGVAGTGKPVTAQSMAFYRLENGRIVEERAQLDLLAVLQQIGAIPTK